MNPSSTRTAARPAVAILLAGVAVLAIVASGALGSSPAPSPTPKPTGSPVVTPTPKPTGSPVVTPTPKPTESPSGDVVVDLDVATDHDVSVLVLDTSGHVVKATSGRAGDGMSVRWGKAKVTNVAADTIRIVWVGLPRDEQVRLTVTDTDSGYTIEIVQAAPPANSDAIGFDRVLDLSFDADVSADDITVVVK